MSKIRTTCDSGVLEAVGEMMVCGKGWHRVGPKCLKVKTIKTLIQLHGEVGAVLAISDTYDIDETVVAHAIKPLIDDAKHC